MISHMNISEKAKKDAMTVYEIIGQAESTVHDKPMTDIHFHEVGTLDAVTDVVGNCILMDMIGADRIVVSPICTGSGTVKCAHGILPVPAPATALILNGLPVYAGKIESELCTPTGAALLKHFGQEFRPMPVMSVEKTGYGLGTKDFPQANMVRVMLGEEVTETAQATPAAECSSGTPSEIIELAANIDDMTGEELAFAVEMIMNAGALDAYTAPITMKKGRPAQKLVVAVKPEDADRIASVIFKHTTTIGIRKYECGRYILDRREESVSTEFGEISQKVCTGYGTEKKKFEFEDLAKLARENGISIMDIKNALK